MRVLFYGKLADLLGREMEVETPPRSIAALRDAIIESHPGVAAALRDRRVRACLGNELVADDHAITGSDEVEFLAPVSGG